VALDTELRREVALKRIQRRYAHDPLVCRRFLQEAEITGQLEHPGIVPVYGLVQDSTGQPCYAMRFIEGESLRDAIKRFHDDSPAARDDSHRRLALRQLLGCLVSICNTIAYAHSRGIVHRDLKPSNVLLGKFGETLVVDWGLAKPFSAGPEKPSLKQPGTDSKDHDRSEESTLVGQILGTPGFMSPEQAAGRADASGPSSDIYGLGAILYTLLAGRAPAVSHVTERDWKWPREIKSSAPRELDAICRKAMALSAEHRYQTALELAADIEHWLADEPVSAWSEPRSLRARRWLGRHRTVVGAAAAALVVATAGLAVGLMLLAEGKEREQLARREAEQQRDASRLSLYVSHMNLAQRAWEDGRADRMLELLDAQRPERTGNKDLRAWEWFYLWGLGRSDTLQAHSTMIGGVDFSPDGRYLASAGYDGVAKIWDLANRKTICVIQGHTEGIRGLAFHPDGGQIACADDGGTASIWMVPSGQSVRILRGHSGPVSCVAYSRSGRHLASGGEDRTVRVWELATGDVLLTLQEHRAAVRGLAFSPDGRWLASASLDGTVKIWDVAARSSRSSVTFKGHADRVGSVAFSPDGTRLASAGWDRAVMIWEMPAGGAGDVTVPALVLHGHTAPIYSLAFSNDGLRLASGGFDRLVKIWETSAGGEVLSLKGHTGAVHSVAFSPDGRHLVSAGDEGTARIWDAPPVTPEEGLQPEALSLVRSLFGQPLPREDVISHLHQDATLAAAVRRQALVLAEHYPEQVLGLNNTAWAVVVLPDREPSAYRLALRKAEAACRLVPEDGALLNTLGVAQFRLGMYHECIATLTRSDQIHSASHRGSSPMDLGPLAMAHHRLGHEATARKYLERLREITKKPQWGEDQEAQGLRREAEALLSRTK
jgi:WD40 repeat protein/tRNA A-37 threonylcarbamoyl transferase component Bud32